MSETDFTLSSQAQITPEEIEKRSFSSKVRGVSESEVRSFLRRISEEVTRLSNREKQLIEKVKKLETAQSAKHVASKQELLESLGEQTAKILMGAEEAAEQMIVDAKTLAADLTEKAKKSFEDMKIKTDDEKELREKEIEIFFENSKKQAIKNAEIIVENARVHGREIFQEATMLREKILKDLLRRRELLSEQIDELRKGREELLDSYKVVKGSFQKATDALQGVEEKASSELMSNPIDVDELLAAHVELPAILNSSNAIEAFIDETYVEETKTSKAPISNSDISEESHSSVNIISKDSVPAKEELKNEISKAIYDQEVTESKKTKSLKGYMKGALGVDTPVANETVDLNVLEAEEKTDAINNEVAEDKKDVSEIFSTLKTKAPEKAPVKDSVMRKTEPETQIPEVKIEKKKAIKKVNTESPIEARDEVVLQSSSAALRKAKKQLQNEQNELLDAVRTTKSKKRLNATDVLPLFDAHSKLWIENLREEIEIVFASGVSSVSKEKISISEEAFSSVISWIVDPLRETLTSAIDEGDAADVTTRVGAKYREWRNNDLKIALNDALCATYSQGVLAGAPKGSVMQWVVEKAGQCVDCDDNALEPTKANEAFPTGQTYAPAHSGCRCVIAVK